MTDNNIKFINEMLKLDKENHDSFLEERARRNNFWNILKLLRTEYQIDHNQFDAYEFEEWVREQYGIQLNFVGGDIGGDYQVVDEKKYLIYLLKFQ
jgi:hypothetical protein